MVSRSSASIAALSLKISGLLVGGANLAHAVERLLDRLGDLDLLGAHAVEHRGSWGRVLYTARQRPRERSKTPRSPAASRKKEQRRHEHNGACDDGTPKLSSTAVSVLHSLNVARDGFRLDRPHHDGRKTTTAVCWLGNPHALLALLVKDAVGVVILLPVKTRSTKKTGADTAGIRQVKIRLARCSTKPAITRNKKPMPAMVMRLVSVVQKMPRLRRRRLYRIGNTLFE